MSSTAVVQAAYERKERLEFSELDRRLDLLLENLAESPNDHFQKVSSDPRKMGYLRFLLKHYAKFPHPWRECVKDNTKRFGPVKVKGLCGVLKDILRQRADWRGKGPNPHDVGSPGVGIGDADASAAPAWGGHHGLSEDGRALSLMDDLDMNFGVVDHTEAMSDVIDVLIELGERCDVYRVLIGLDAPPTFEVTS